MDESAVRQARNVELVVTRDDLRRIEVALSHAGFFRATRDGRIRFIDGHHGRWRDAIELTFGGEQMASNCPERRSPLPSDFVVLNGNKVLQLKPLAEFQLARNRLDDRVDLRDMIEVSLLDATWLQRLPAELAARLKELLDNPDG